MMFTDASLNDTAFDNLAAYVNETYGQEFGGIAASAYDPSALSLTAWFKPGDFAVGGGSATWTGTASAGASGTVNATNTSGGADMPAVSTPTWIGNVDVTVTTPVGTSDPVTFEYWSPAAARFTGLWRAGSYGVDAGVGTWEGSPSAGLSGNRDAAEATTPPSVAGVGSTLNSLATVDFDGTDDRLLEHANTAVPNYWSATEWSAAVLFYARSTGTWGGYGAGYTYPTFVTDTANAYYYFSLTDQGVLFGHYDGTNFQEIVNPASTSAWHLAVGWYDGTNLNLEIDGVAATPVAVDDAFDPGGGLNIGVSYNESVFFDGIMGELALSDISIAPIKGKYLAYIKQRYGVLL
jgi:hypothetical protein